jgi:hypothetical protein
VVEVETDPKSAVERAAGAEQPVLGALGLEVEVLETACSGPRRREGPTSSWAASGSMPAG